MATRFFVLARGEDAATAVEYAIILALILLAVFSAVTSVGNTSSGIWFHDVSKIQSATSGS